MTYYTGNITNTPETLAVLPAPYYWWESGAMWGAMLDYYHYTGDSSYNSVVTQALLSQVGPEFDYMVPRHQKDEGNDDQAFWGFATMAAAERNFPDPPSGTPTWLQLTINLWNTQVYRWDNETCGGGLKWQIFQFNNGYDYKNSVSNGAFFQLSARLARFTGNSTYLEWAEKTWDWQTAIGIISPSYKIYDGTDDLKNCSDLTLIQWTYNHGIHLYGAAVMYNYTTSDKWETRVAGLMKTGGLFFSPDAPNVMYEPACETVNTCNTDQWSFKAYLSRFMWATTKLAAFTTPAVTTLLTTSSKAAAKACSGPTDGAKNGTTCGAKWYTGEYDDTKGVGQQLSALEVIQGLLINSTMAPFTSGNVVSNSFVPPSAARLSSTEVRDLARNEASSVHN